MYATESPYPPSSSPPSSPNTYWDSSPAPSSPTEDIDFEFEPNTPPSQHPFAGSSKATRSPIIYDKSTRRQKRALPESPTQEHIKRARHATQLESDTSFGSILDPPPDLPYASLLFSDGSKPPPLNEQVKLFEDASDRCFEESHGTVNLENKRLSLIPYKFLEDINDLVIPSEHDEIRYRTITSNDSLAHLRSFKRGHSGPAKRQFSRNVSHSSSERQNIQLFLRDNLISTLPPTLFNISRLTVLSIANNNITSLPPEICRLRNLRTLNIALNPIPFLPAEMLEMNLETVTVYPNNHFVPTPLDSPRVPPYGIVGPVERVLPKTLTLVELCLRKVLPRQSESGNSILKERYDLPIGSPDPPSDPSKIWFKTSQLPPDVYRLFDICEPDSVYESDSAPMPDAPLSNSQSSSHSHSTSTTLRPSLYDSVTGVSVCPSPLHPLTRGHFVGAAEERTTWTKFIGKASLGGEVPFKWRGCQWGCLGFLDGKERGVSPEGGDGDEAGEDDDPFPIVVIPVGPFDFEDE